MQNCYFGLLVFSQSSFHCGSSNPTGHSLTITNCHFDKIPNNYDSPCTFVSPTEDNPLRTQQINHLGLEMCPIPTKLFTKSEIFTLSSVFPASNTFSNSEKFTKSSEKIH